VDASALTVVGLQAKPDTWVGATKLRGVVWDELLKEAVTVAVCVVAMVPRFAFKVADVVFAGTVTDAGTVSAGLLLESPIVLPPEPAA